MRWFRTKNEIQVEEDQTFQTNLAKKLEGYESTGQISTYSATNTRAADPFDELHGDGVDADPRWLAKTDPYVVEEIALTDLSEKELQVVDRLRQAYLANLEARELQADPDTQRFDALLRGE